MKTKLHIVIIVTLSLVWLILSANGNVALAASEWFVRPAGGNYGTEDGTSYQDAWDGLKSVVWGAGGVQPGDNLYVCGLHLWPETPPNQVSRNWYIGISGTGENSRITIRGDYTEDQGIIWGVQTLSGNLHKWTHEGNNVYSTISENYYTFFFEDVTATSWTLLTRVNSIQECENTPGSYYSPTYKYPDPFYVHCSDNGNPTDRIVAGANGWHIHLTNRQYITFKNIEFYVPKFSWGLYDQAISYIRWEGCKLWYGCFYFRDGCHHIEIINCDRAYGKGGFGFQDYYSPHGTDTPHHMTIRGCYIHDIGIYRQNPDAEGIGVNGCDNLTIENNEFYNCGSAFTSYPYTEQTNKNTIIRWNYIHDMHTIGGARGRGIELNMHPPNAQDRSGCQVYGNIVANCPGVGYRSTFDQNQVLFYNNVAYNCDYSFYFNFVYRDYTGPNITLRNNISVGPRTMHIYFGSATGEDNYTIDSDYNLFYPDKPKGFGFKESGYATYPDLSGWQALSRAGCTFDQHSLIGNPQFTNAPNYSQAADFKLQGYSPAIDAGVDVGLTRDFEGIPVPQGLAPDIGAYEYRSEDEIKPEDTLPDKTELTCYNNLFNPAKGEKALIVVELQKQAHVKLGLYNTRGNRIRELADEEKEAGTHKYYWDGRSGNGNVVGSGLYFVHIQAGDYKKTKKIVVVK